MRLLSSLTNRIFLASSLLAVLSIGVAVYVVNAAVTAQAEAELQRGLEEASTLVEQYRAMLFENFTQQARLIADLPKFKAAVALDDPPTLGPLAQDYRRQINCDLLVVTNRDARVLGQSGTADARVDSDVAVAAIRNALGRKESASFWPDGGGFLQVVSVPVWIGLDQPEILGSLSVGFRLDRGLARRFKELTDSEVAFAVAGVVQAATLPDQHLPALAAALDRPGITTLTIGQDEYVAVTQPLTTERAPAAGDLPLLAGPASAGPVAIILRSRTERLRFLRPLHIVLAATALGAVFAATLLSYGIARTVTRPLGAITATMREMAETGDIGRKISLPVSGRWDDEDARLLARTFDTMTDSIARFQREAAQRERLSSLGRLSTVVAHEIRNPLMIIKASLRALRRFDAAPDHVRDAVADIDGEVARLNRIVTEVLDFARPIRFEHAATDVNGLCRDAAAASAAGEPDVIVKLQLDPGLSTIVTDAERLRLALVNILTNARHAVLEARADDEIEPARPADRASAEPDSRAARPIELITEPLSDHRVAIVVRDSGGGIAPEDLPRIFEPYFTTKRTGSGLGLAIAKNIVEGLGGTIQARSRRGSGAEIRIELPERPRGEAASAPGPEQTVRTTQTPPRLASAARRARP